MSLYIIPWFYRLHFFLLFLFILDCLFLCLPFPLQNEKKWKILVTKNALKKCWKKNIDWKLFAASPFHSNSLLFSFLLFLKWLAEFGNGLRILALKSQNDNLIKHKSSKSVNIIDVTTENNRSQIGFVASKFRYEQVGSHKYRTQIKHLHTKGNIIEKDTLFCTFCLLAWFV